MESFENLEDWLREIRLNSDPDVVVYLAGNMLDLADEEREVSTATAEKFVSEKKLDGFIEASAKTADHVAEVFVKIAEVLYKKKLHKEANEAPKATPLPNVVLDTKKAPPKKKGCC